MFNRLLETDMLRGFILAVVLAAASAPAFAADIAVPPSGQDTRQTQAEIRRTALSACRDDSYGTLESIASCGERARLASTDWTPLDIR